jgi:hypothetical protein
MWILDDLSPLHQLNDQVAQSAAFLFEPRDSYRLNQGPARRSGNTNTFRDRYDGSALDWDRVGEDGPVGAVMYYYLGESPSGEVTLEFLEEDGDVIKTFSSEDEDSGVTKEKGMNRYSWDLRYPDADIIPGTSFRGTTRGPKAVPGSYQVKLTVSGQSQTKPFRILIDPRLDSTQADLEEQFEMLIKIRDAITETYDGIKKIRGLKEQIAKSTQNADDSVKKAGEDLATALTSIEHELIEPRIEYREDCWNFASKLNHFWSYLAQKMSMGDYKPTDAGYERFKELRGMLDEQNGRLKQAVDNDVAKFNQMLRDKGLQPVTP